MKTAKEYLRDPMALIRDALEDGIRAVSIRGVLSRDPEMPSSTAPSSGEREDRQLLLRGIPQLAIDIISLKFFGCYRDSEGRVVSRSGERKVGEGIYVSTLSPETLPDADIARHLGIAKGTVRAAVTQAKERVVANIHARYDAEQREAERERIRGWRERRVG